jgi:hypothetical protein
LIARTGQGRRRRTANGGIDGWKLNAADSHVEAPFQVSRGRSPAQSATARLYARAVINYWAVIFERFEGFSDRRDGASSRPPMASTGAISAHMGAHIGTQVVYAHRRRNFATQADTRSRKLSADNRRCGPESTRDPEPPCVAGPELGRRLHSGFPGGRFHAQGTCPHRIWQ